MVTYQKNFVIKVIYFHFSIVNCPYLCSHKALSPAYGAFISQFIQYSRAGSTYEQFLMQEELLTNKLIKEDYQ